MARIRNRYGRKPICSKCGNLKERSDQGYCNGCRNEWSRKNRPVNHSLSLEQQRKIKARAYLNVYISRGKIKKGVCFCGETKVEAHHADYDKPLEVTWLCRKHHLSTHDHINREPYIYDKNEKYQD